MNLELPPQDYPENITEAQLAEGLFRFSDVLAAGAWARHRTNEVRISRTLTERLDYRDVMLSGEGFRHKEDIEVGATASTVKLSLLGEKRFVRISKKLATYVPFYYISSTTSQSLEKEEIPPAVLGDIIEDAQDETSALYQEYEDVFGDSDEGITIDNLDDLYIDGVQKVKYQIDHNGVIQKYKLSRYYTVNGIKTCQNTYSTDDPVGDWQRTTPWETRVDEYRPAIVPIISEQSIVDELKDFDETLKELLDDDELRENIEFAGQPIEEHRKRILAMTALLSSGFIK